MFSSDDLKAILTPRRLFWLAVALAVWFAGDFVKDVASMNRLQARVNALVEHIGAIDAWGMSSTFVRELTGCSLNAAPRTGDLVKCQPDSALSRREIGSGPPPSRAVRVCTRTENRCPSREEIASCLSTSNAPYVIKRPDCPRGTDCAPVMRHICEGLPGCAATCVEWGTPPPKPRVSVFAYPFVVVGDAVQRTVAHVWQHSTTAGFLALGVACLAGAMLMLPWWDFSTNGLLKALVFSITVPFAGSVVALLAKWFLLLVALTLSTAIAWWIWLLATFGAIFKAYAVFKGALSKAETWDKANSTAAGSGRGPGEPVPADDTTTPPSKRKTVAKREKPPADPASDA